MQYIQTKTVYIDRDELIEIKALEGDIKTRFVNFRFIGGSKILDISNCTVRVFAVNSKGNEIFNDLKTIDSKKGLAQLELTNSMLQAGTTEYQLKIFDANGGVLGSNLFKIIVGNNLMKENSISESNEYKALIDALGTVQGIANKLEKEDFNNFINALKKLLTTNRIQVIGTKDLPDYPVDIKNFGGDRQNLISFCIHNYSDSEGIRVDNVGGAPCLVLKNAHNNINRPDKPSNYCGKGLYVKFLKAYFDEIGSEQTMEIFQIDADTRIKMANDCHIKNIAPSDNGVWGFSEENYHMKPYVKTLINGDDMVENIQYGNTVSDYYTKEYQPNIIHKFVKGIARFIHSKNDDGVWGWTFECLNKLKYAFAFKNGEDIAFSVEDEQVNFYYPLRIRPIDPSTIKYGNCLFVDKGDSKLKFMDNTGVIKTIVME